MAYRIEVVIRVVNDHGDTVDPTGRPAMMPSEHQHVKTYPVKFNDARDAFHECRLYDQLIPA